MKCKAYLINVYEQTITDIEYEPTSVDNRIATHIGNNCSLIDVAFHWRKTGDTLYVDDEGLLKEPRHFFLFEPRNLTDPLAGNGVLVGREVETPTGWYTTPPHITIEHVRAVTVFGKINDR